MLYLLTARVRAVWHAAISLLLTASILLLTLTFTPASTASGVMSCCPDGSSTHCSGMKVEAESEPEPEPTCGHESVGEEAEDTIIAEPEYEDSSQDSSANNLPDPASQPFVNAPCAVDCCPLAWSCFTRLNRDPGGLVPRKAAPHQFARQSTPLISPVLQYASQRFNQPTPRGPPLVSQ